MGIKNLTKVLGDHAPSCCREQTIADLSGRIIAIDGTMTLYQFMIALTHFSYGGFTDENGTTTNHLQGLFYRVNNLLSNGIRPIYVFDGKPPEQKRSELQKRSERRNEAIEQAEKAKEDGNTTEWIRFMKRSIKVTSDLVDEAVHLLGLMGVPVIIAEQEAEATCAALVKNGTAYATATEDMDALALGSNILLRNLSFAKKPVREFQLSVVLQELKMDMDTFIDLCILLGCDYCDTIRGVGPVKAVAMIRKYGSIEQIVKYEHELEIKNVEEYLENVNHARDLLKNPNVGNIDDLLIKWTEPNVEEIVNYLCKQKGFNEDRIKKALTSMIDAKCKQYGVQTKLENYFGPVTKIINPKAKQKQKKKQKPKISKRRKVFQ